MGLMVLVRDRMADPMPDLAALRVADEAGVINAVAVAADEAEVAAASPSAAADKDLERRDRAGISLTLWRILHSMLRRTL